MRPCAASVCVVLGVVLGSSVGLTACGGEVPFELPPLDANDVDTPPLPPAVVPVIRVLSWPGRGLQLAVELPDRLAAEAPGSLPAAWIETGDGQRIEAEVARAAVTTGVTAVVIAPSSDPAIHAMRQAAADAIIAKLPAGERVALYVARAHADLIADLAIPRDHARARLAALAPEGGGIPAIFALREVREALAELQSSHGDLGRVAILVGDTAVEDPPEVRRVVQTLSMPVDGDPITAATTLVNQLQARRAAILRIGACAGFLPDAPFTLHLGTGYAMDLYAPEVMDHVADEPCDAADIAADRYPYPSEIDFAFTPEQLVVFNQVYASANENQLFELSVKLGVGTEVMATAHLRGQGTLGCQRKSFTVEMTGPRRRLMPGVAAPRFFLISMCQDDYYFGQVFVDRLLRKLDLFAPHLRFVKVRVDGVNRGVYLLVDQPDNSLRDNNLAIQSVLRRRYDILNQPAEVKYPDDPVLAAAEAAQFEALGDLANAGPLANLDAELHARIDMNAYTRLLALYSLVQNGDYIDEFYFYGSSEVGTEVQGGEHYRAMGWDTDDAFSPCHGGGGNGIVDRCGLTYCAEAELDHALLRSNETYNRFMASLEDVLGQITPEVMATTMAQVKSELFAVLDDDETARAMVEMGSLDLATGRAAISSRIDMAMALVTMNHATLLTRRAMCPAMP